MQSFPNLRAFIVHTPQLDRSSVLKSQLTSMQIEYEMVESLSFWHDSEKLSNFHNGHSLYELTIGRNLSLAEIGGSLGHQLAYARIVESGIKWGMIFEDDAQLAAVRLDEAATLINEVTSLQGPAHVNLAEFTRAVPYFGRKVGNLTQLVMPSTWAHAYLIDFEAAKKYNHLYNTYGVTSYPDWPYPQPAGVKFFISNRELFRQEVPKNYLTMTDERLKIPMQNSHYSLVMPISLPKLLSRVSRLSKQGFHLRHLLYHEILIRFVVRFNKGIFKVNRLANGM